MHIGILTQALYGNYGGILQNFALQQVLVQMGHTPMTIDRHMSRSESKIKDLAKKVMRLRHSSFDASLLTSAEKKKLNSKQLDFINQNIRRIGPILTQETFDKIASNPEYDAFIVGSDQCWRPCYSANIANYYLDFAENRPARRIAYAASFGVDNWEYTPAQTELVSKHASHLNAVSVREESGLRLCNDYLGVNAVWVLDPTMLLGKEGFRKFLKVNRNTGEFITEYLLEATPEAEAMIERAMSICDAEICISNNRSKSFRRFNSLSKYTNISVEEWITNIANAKFVITDSFHGAVFSIMFNVPFIVKLNGTRGNARIESLLRDFGLEYCISNCAEFDFPEIDWDRVNAHLEKRQAESKQFLVDALM